MVSDQKIEMLFKGFGIIPRVMPWTVDETKDYVWYKDQISHLNINERMAELECSGPVTLKNTD